MIKKWGIGWMMALGLAACQTPTQEPVAKFRYVGHSKTMKHAYTLPFEYDVLATEIENYLEHPNSGQGVCYPDFIRNYFALQNYQPHWINLTDTLSHHDFLTTLALADIHGLDRNTYHYEQLETNFENLAFFYFQTGNVNYQLWAESEILLTDALLLLAQHLRHGLYNPLADRDYHYFIAPSDTAFSASGIFYADSLKAFMQNLTPAGMQYKKLQYEFAKRLKKPEKSRTIEDADTLDLLRVNLERWRWNALFMDTGYHVYVNIPAFELRVLKMDSTYLQSNVCVGVKRPKNYEKLREAYLKNPRKNHKPLLHETPVLKSKIDHLTLNPQWYVPDNIGKFEILNHLKKDTNYLEKMNYQVYHGTKPIDPDGVDWHAVSVFNFPYRFVQDAGNFNALGKIKFMFLNGFSVYLHDTPYKRAFSRRNRAITHGCVRVERYLDLAHILLADMPKYDLKFIKNAIGLGRKNIPENTIKTKIISFKTAVPVVIDYKTAWIDESGQLNIFPDVYGRDQLVLNALQNQHLQESKTKE